MKTKNLTYALFFILIILFSSNSFSQVWWTQQNSGTNEDLDYVEFVDEFTGFTGDPSLKTTNGGESWFLIPGLSCAMNMDMVNQNTGYAACNNIFKTVNGGTNWTTVTPYIPLWWHVSFINEQTGFIGGDHDQLRLSMFSTTNSGINWTEKLVLMAQGFPNTMYFNDIKALSSQTIYCTIFYYYWEPPNNDRWYYLRRSVNGGNTFNILLQSDTLEFMKLSIPEASAIYLTALGNSGTSYVLRGNGLVSLASDIMINGLYFPTGQIGYAVCDSGVIYKTTSAGANWYILNTGTNINLNKTYFVNEQTGWVIGKNGLILKTTTGGEEPVLNSISGLVRYEDNNQPVDYGYVKAVRYDSITHNIITVDSAQIQTNGAYTLPNCPPIILDIMAYENDEDELSFVPTYYVSTIYWQNAVHVRPDSNLTNINIGVKRTVNPGGSMYISGYIYSNSSLDYTALKDAVVYSRAAGQFKGHSISLSNGYYRIDSLSAGTYELIVNRMGYNTSQISISITNSSLNNINFYLDNYSVPVIITGSKTPDNFSLNQNYPNPFNPLTNIEFEIPKLSLVKLVIYNVLGKEVETLVKGNLNGGIYKAEWDASNYPSGVYYYRLTSGDPSVDGHVYSDTRKMILIK